MENEHEDLDGAYNDVQDDDVPFARPRGLTWPEGIVIYGMLCYTCLCVIGVTLWLMKLAVGLLVRLL